MTSISIIGVGNMGGGMARNLLSKNYCVHVVDIDASKTEALAKQGATVHADATSLPTSCQVVIVCVVDSKQTLAVLPTIAATSLGARAVMLCPTIAPEDVELFATSLAEKGLQVIDAPMSGGPARAENGTMSLMVACTDYLFAQHQVLLNDLSTQIFRVSDKPGDGARMKLCNNLLAGINLAGAAEVLALAERMGLDARKALAVMQSSSAQSWIGQDRMSRALDDDYAPRAHMTLLAKDTQLALAMAAKAGVDCLVGNPAAEAFADAASQGYANFDDAALLKFFRKTLMPSKERNQFDLLRQRRFAPFFWTQFAGAANDNLFKFALTVMVTYQLSVSWLPSNLAGLVIGAVFILPFVLFSATSGQLADKLDKAAVFRFVKNLEIAIMLLGAYGFYASHVVVLLVCVFLMGLHSTLFGPVKFAYIPQVLDEREITGGNGVVEMGTFVAILLGNIVGGVLVALPEVGHAAVAVTCIALAVLGRMAAQAIPSAPSTDPDLVMNWNPISETMKNLKLAHSNIVVFRTLLGISWMWFFGAVFLGQFPSLAKDVLHGDANVASLLLVVFSIGIGVGSLLCEVLSKRHVEMGLVPFGAIGMSAFAIDFYFATHGLPPSVEMGAAAFAAQPAHWRVMTDLALLALFAGLYSVPMYALVQLRTDPSHRARIIAANNILNALFMIVSSIMAGALLSLGATIPQIFLLVGIANAIFTGYIFWLTPEYFHRFKAIAPWSR